MTPTKLKTDDFQSIVTPLIGLPVSRPWQGYGSVLFLELGDLHTVHYGTKTSETGQAGLCIEWDWRVEDNKAILYGSSNSRPEIEQGMSNLRGETVISIGIVGIIPEITVEFSNGHILRSMIMTTGSPQWYLRIREEEYIWAKGDSIYYGNEYGCGEDLSERENFAIDTTESTVKRWNISTKSSSKGCCLNCKSFIYLDGPGYLLDYGVCTSEHSDFDGSVVPRGNGCKAFSKET